MKKLIIFLVVIVCSLATATGQTWTANKKYIKSHGRATSDTAGTKQQAFQCYGTTTKGQRCKHRVTVLNGYCWQHEGQR